MDHYYLLGTPIAHSLSPAMMNYSFGKLGVNARYDLMETDEEHLAAAVERLKEEGAKGWNVTMPCKQAMSALCDELSTQSLIGGSVNTVKNDNGKLTGYTTDGIGLTHALSRASVSIKGESVTLLGTGGAACAILIQAALEGAANISVFANRPTSFSRVRGLAERIAEYSDSCIRIFTYEDPSVLKEELRKSRILIQATNVGMESGRSGNKDCLIPDESFLHPDLFVYDIIYHPAKTPLLEMAERSSVRAENGLSMLLGQGEESFRIWTGLKMPLDDLVRDLFH